MTFRTLVVAAAVAVAAVAAPAANAAIFTVNALSNSSSGGTGLASLSVNAGSRYTVSASLTDLWSAGALPRWSNANGLTGNTFATGTDESGEPAGTLIGADFGLHSQAGLSAPFGSLVGEIGGVYQLLGASFNGPAWGTGTLNLYYWDSNNGDNSGTIDVNVSAVPEPQTWVMLIVGFGLVGVSARRRHMARIAA
jgi:hypothetical protein